jgi:hypothetical protein
LRTTLAGSVIGSFLSSFRGNDPIVTVDGRLPQRNRWRL